MQLGVVVLGKMGANAVQRLLRGGHECAAYDRDPAQVQALAARLVHPRAVW